MNQKTDVESESFTSLIYLAMTLKHPELPRAFIRNYFAIVAIQLLITITVAAVVVAVEPIFVFFTTTFTGLALYIVLYFTPLIVSWPLFFNIKRYPVNYFLLAIFTVAVAFAVGLMCACTSRKIISEVAILPAGLVASLTWYAFWAARRGYYFNFFGHFSCGVILVSTLFLIIQIVFFSLSQTQRTQIMDVSSAFVFQSFLVFVLYIIQITGCELANALSV